MEEGGKVRQVGASLVSSGSEASSRERESRSSSRLSSMDCDNSPLISSHSYVYVDTPNSNLLCCICRSVPSSRAPLRLSHYNTSLQNALRRANYESNLRT